MFSESFRASAAFSVAFGVSLLSPHRGISKIFSINSFQFWPDPDASLVELRRILKPGGLIALAVQPRGKGVTGEDTHMSEIL